MRNRELIELANTKVAIEDILLESFNIDVPKDVDGWKSDCPKGSEHSDGGRTKAMRVYSDSNSAWCFRCSEKFLPVNLWQLVTGTASPVKAAKDMLEHYGVRTTPPTPQERWEAMENKETEEVEYDSLKEVFLNYAKTLPAYAVRQYEDPVLKAVTTVLNSADLLPKGAGSATLQEWIREAKSAFAKFWKERYEQH